MVLVVILGRTGRTEFNFPATIAALVANVALNLLLVPSLGIVGAGLALVASYLVVLALMYVFTQRLFPVPYEWGRLRAGRARRRRPGRRRRAAAADRRAPPACSAAPLLCAAYPLALLASGFFTAEERGWLALPAPPRRAARRACALRRAGRRPSTAAIPEVYEAERIDEDARPAEAPGRLRCGPADRSRASRPVLGSSAWRAWAQ